MRPACVARFALAAALTAPLPRAAAQTGVEVTPALGLYWPAHPTVASGPRGWMADQNGGWLWGGEVTAWLGSRVALEASFSHSGAGTTYEEPFVSCTNCFTDNPCPCGYGYDATPAGGSVTMMSARLVVIILRSRSSRASLYVLGGPAVVLHSRYDSLFPGAIAGVAGGPEMNPAVVAGVGGALGFGRSGLGVRLEVEDFLYSGVQFYNYPSRFQQNVVVRLGPSISAGWMADAARELGALGAAIGRTLVP